VVLSFYLQNILPLLIMFRILVQTARTAMWFHSPVETLVAMGCSLLYEDLVIKWIERKLKINKRYYGVKG